MKLLITGAKGFVGSNLMVHLQAIVDGKIGVEPMHRDMTLLPFDLDSDVVLLDSYCRDADFVFHLAGVNRPETEAEFMSGNFGFTSELLHLLQKHGNRCPILLASSTQAALNNPYGISKRAGEELLFQFQEEHGNPVLVYRFPNLFGKWCRPNYNSAVATFCHNITRDLAIQVNDRQATLTLCYIDDVLEEMVQALLGNANRKGDYCEVATSYQRTLGAVVDLLYSFKASRENYRIANMGDAFTKKLYATYLSYLPTDKFGYAPITHSDVRGSFTELFKSDDRGQVSVNISKSHITKGNHWHHTKNEKFVVVSGRGVIRFRDMRVADGEVISYEVSGDKLEVSVIPTGYTHNIENLGATDMVTVVWCNE